MATPIPGKGCTLEYENPTSTWNAVGAIKDMTFPTYSRDVIDVTTQDSASDHREFKGGMIDGGSLTFNCLYDPDDADHTFIVETDMVRAIGSDPVQWRVSLTDTTATVMTFTGFVSSVSVSSPMEDYVMLDVEIKVTGAISFS